MSFQMICVGCQTIGDCVLLKCESVLTSEQELIIKDLYWKISKNTMLLSAIGSVK